MLSTVTMLPLAGVGDLGVLSVDASWLSARCAGFRISRPDPLVELCGTCTGDMAGYCNLRDNR
jgi:hypothetical protein